MLKEVILKPILKRTEVKEIKHIVSFSGGKDSTAMLLKMIEKGMQIDDIIYCEIMATSTLGAEYPEMYEYLDKVDKYLLQTIGKKITRIKSDISFEQQFYTIKVEDLKNLIISGIYKPNYNQLTAYEKLELKRYLNKKTDKFNQLCKDENFRNIPSFIKYKTLQLHIVRWYNTGQ